MNVLIKYFLSGLLAFLPVALTVYAVWVSASWLNHLTARAVELVAPGLPAVPGLGIALAVVALTALGVLVRSRLTRWVYRLLEMPLKRTPIVRDIYEAVRQLVSLIAPSDPERSGVMVCVRHPGLPIKLVGLMTRTDTSDLDPGIAGADEVAVYLPMSYQIGGYTVFVPRAWVTPLEMGAETGMRNAMTAWVRGEDLAAPTRPGAAAKA